MFHAVWGHTRSFILNIATAFRHNTQTIISKQNTHTRNTEAHIATNHTCWYSDQSQKSSRRTWLAGFVQVMTHFVADWELEGKWCVASCTLCCVICSNMPTSIFVSQQTLYNDTSTQVRLCLTSSEDPYSLSTVIKALTRRQTACEADKQRDNWVSSPSHFQKKADFSLDVETN